MSFAAIHVATSHVSTISDGAAPDGWAPTLITIGVVSAVALVAALVVLRLVGGLQGLTDTLFPTIETMERRARSQETKR